MNLVTTEIMLDVDNPAYYLALFEIQPDETYRIIFISRSGGNMSNPPVRISSDILNIGSRDDKHAILLPKRDEK